MVWVIICYLLAVVVLVVGVRQQQFGVVDCCWTLAGVKGGKSKQRVYVWSRPMLGWSHIQHFWVLGG